MILAWLGMIASRIERSQSTELPLHDYQTTTPAVDRTERGLCYVGTTSAGICSPSHSWRRASGAILPKRVKHCGIHSVISSGFVTCKTHDARHVAKLLLIIKSGCHIDSLSFVTTSDHEGGERPPRGFSVPICLWLLFATT